MNYATKALIFGLVLMLSLSASSCKNNQDEKWYIEEYKKELAKEGVDYDSEEGKDIFMKKYADAFLEDYMDEDMDGYAERYVSDPIISKDYMIPNKECAEKYARLLYDEDCGGRERSLDIWVKYYKEYGLWVAWLKYPPSTLSGLTHIVFQAKDGKVVYYGGRQH